MENQRIRNFQKSKNKIMKQLRLTFLFVAIASCITSSCKHHQQPKNIIVLPDLSDSRDSAIINWYEETTKNSVLARMGTKDRLTVLPVDHNSETWGQEIFKIDFSKNDYRNEYAGLQSNEVEKKNFADSVATAIQQFEISFNAARTSRISFNKGTDILGALKQAQKYFIPGDKNIIVLLSDMLQATDKTKMDFENHFNDLDEIDHYLSSAEKTDLRNMHIIVLTGAQSRIKPEKFSVIKSFWEKYFVQCHGQLVDYSSGAVSILEEHLSDN
jgi:hypothetical protein